MSEGIRPFTPTTAPRQGGKPGRKAKLSAQALEILNRLLVDWTKHGAATLRVLRLERPDLYAKLALETAARLTLAAESAGDGEPVILSVRWGDPRHPAPAPPESPPVLPPSSPQLLTFRRPLV
jgi:hypothetical protein